MNRWKKLFKRSKKGMSLMVVLVSIAMLVVMGTMFTTIAMRSFNYSYSKLCKQQAYYTAESAANILADLLYDSDEAFAVINNVIQAKYEQVKDDPSQNITQIYCNVGKVGGAAGLVESADLSPTSVIYSDGLFKDLMGTCDLRVRFTNEQLTEMSLEAVATYKGYSSTVKMLIAKTNKGAEELKKIFSNSFCWSNPIVSMVNNTIDGNITITSPGEYVRDANGNIISGNPTNDEIKEIYSKVDVYDGQTTRTGHTKEFDIYNNLLRADNGNIYPADWTEIYMFSGTPSGRPNEKTGTALNGDLYVQSKALLGLWDKDVGDRENVMFWNYDTYRKDYVNYINGDTYKLGTNYEHDFTPGGSVFFDHLDTEKTTIDGIEYTVGPTKVDYTKMRVNGEVWLWDDARIENFDSLNTANAYAGIKNNIYAMKNLVIDGFCFQGKGLGDDYKYSRETSIYGDIMVQGDLQISNAIIVGDIYCNGDNLYLVDTTVFGNIYFRGTNLQMDWCQVYGEDGYIYDDVGSDKYKRLGAEFTSSSLPVQRTYADKAWFEHDSVRYNGPTQTISGGNIIVAGLNADGTPNTEAKKYNSDVNVISDDQYYANVNRGASLTNCTVAGTFYSNVNTIINVAKWNSTGELSHNVDKIDMYGDVIVDGYLFFNLRRAYDGRMDVWDGPQRVSFLEVDNVIAKKVSIAQSQKGEFLLDTIVNDIWFRNIYAEEGGYLLGNNIGEWWPWDDEYKTVKVKNLYVRSGKIDLEDTEIKDNALRYSSANAGVQSNNSKNTTEASEGDIINGLASIISRINGSTFTGTAFASALANVRAHILDKFDRQDIYPSALNEFGELNFISYGFPQESDWEDKEVNMRQWNAPKEDLDGNPETVDIGAVQYIQATELSDLVSKGGATYLDANTLEINSSVEFLTRVSVPDNLTIHFNSINSNLHIKFNNGLVLGNNCKIILKGGHMTFLYLYGANTTYDLGNPHLKTGLNCNIGEILNMEGVTSRSDSLYIITNDMCTMNFGTGTKMVNTYVYAPMSYVALSSDLNIAPYVFNEGAFAVRGYIMTGSVIEYENTKKRYAKFSYKNTIPPLITDSSFEYGNTFDEVDAYGVTIWDFVGYY